MTCPTSQELKSFLDGQLDDTQFERVAEHLESCPECVKALDSLYSGESLNDYILENGPEGGADLGTTLGARQLTQRLLDHQSLPDDQLGPDSVGGIMLVRYLDSGSFGRVFLGWDEELERLVAVKLPRAGLHINDDLIEEFRREARLAAKVEHPGIVPIYDIGIDEELGKYIISAYIDGCNLSHWRKAQKPTFEESIQMVIKIAEIIGFAHEHQLVHRDLKPSNIMVDQSGDPHLVDFGLATWIEPNRERNSTSLIGSPGYFPPEYLETEHCPTNLRRDMYSLGVVLYELLTGSLPYEMKQDSWKTILKNETPVRPRNWNPRIPHDLETLCLKAIHRDPDKRYQNAAEFINDLQSYLADSSGECGKDTSRDF